MSFNNNSKQRLITIGTVLIIFLLGLNAYFFMTNRSQTNTIDDQALQINEVEKVKTELEKQYYEALSSLEEMRSDNDELNTIIEDQKTDLKNQKTKISKIISTGKANKEDLAFARSQIDALVTKSQEYVGQIESLKEENAALVGEKMKLGEEKRILQTEINQEREQNQVLVSQKLDLEAQKEALSEEKAVLSKKVTAAAAIEVSNIAVEGYKVKSNDKLARKRYAKNVEVLKVCFDAMENNVADNGPETFHVRILNPLGETMAVENMGSGIITNSNNNEQMRFTKATEIDYQKLSANTCIQWAPNIDFQKGEYTVEIYNKGYLTGKSKFKLK